MGFRSVLVRLLCLALMVSAVLWPLHGHAQAKIDVAKADVQDVQSAACCKAHPSPQVPAEDEKADDCCKSCTFGTCCLRLMVAERPVVGLIARRAVEVTGVSGPVVLTGLVQLEDVFHPPRA